VDTGVFSWVTWDRGRAAEFTALMLNHVLVLSFPTVGELRYGAIKARWGETKMQILEQRIATYLVITATDSVTRRWAELNCEFKDQIGENDLWIAACALGQPEPLPIITTDLGHFQRIAGKFPVALVHPDL
jgi:predicted nucleic acid-binding protein